MVGTAQGRLCPPYTLRQRDHSGPELLLLGGCVDIIVAHEFELAIAADAEHADRGGYGRPLAHRHRPDRGGDEKPSAWIDPEGAEVVGVRVGILDQCRLAGGLV